MPHATQVVDRVTTTDRVTGRVLEVSYQYAHGVYNGQEREFRGFTRVAQFDREAPGPSVVGDLERTAQVKVVRWSYTGAALDLRDEWFPIPGAPIEDEVPNHPWARRALRGFVCREESYALDGERRPYLVTENGYHVLAVGRSSARLESAWAPLAVHARRTILERTSEARQSEVFTTYDLQEDPAGGYGLPVTVRGIGHGRGGTFSTAHEQQQTASLERVTQTVYVS